MQLITNAKCLVKRLTLSSGEMSNGTEEEYAVFCTNF